MQTERGEGGIRGQNAGWFEILHKRKRCVPLRCIGLIHNDFSWLLNVTLFCLLTKKENHNVTESSSCHKDSSYDEWMNEWVRPQRVDIRNRCPAWEIYYIHDQLRKSQWTLSSSCHKKSYNNVCAYIQSPKIKMWEQQKSPLTSYDEWMNDEAFGRKQSFYTAVHLQSSPKRRM